MMKSRVRRQRARQRFADLPRFDQPSPSQRRWRVERLELVSLLKNDESVAYVSKNLPRMDELRHAPTRPLDAFEERALTALRKGSDLESQRFRDHLRMLGSLRAVKQRA